MEYPAARDFACSNSAAWVHSAAAAAAAAVRSDCRNRRRDRLVHATLPGTCLIIKLQPLWPFTFLSLHCRIDLALR